MNMDILVFIKLPVVRIIPYSLEIVIVNTNSKSFKFT